MEALHPITLGLIAALILSFIISLLSSGVTSVLALVVANTVISNKYIWNIITASLFETSVLKVIIDGSLLVMLSSTLKISGTDKLARYFGAIVLACSAVMSTYSVLAYFASADPQLLLNPIYGFGGIIVAVLMHARLYKGAEIVFPNAPVPIRYDHLPVLYILLEVVFVLTGLKAHVHDLPFSVISIVMSWAYIKVFWRKAASNATTTVAGAVEGADPAADFVFVTMFPESLHIVLVPLFTAFYNLTVVVGVMQPLPEQAERRFAHHLRYDARLPVAGTAAASSSGASGAAVSNVKSSVDIAAERRRAKARELLDAKMAELSKQAPEGWDDAPASSASASLSAEGAVDKEDPKV